MQNLRNKLKKQSGFTLVEMLIVVAIIAILIAISIPLVNKALEKSRDATDEANVRSAKAEAMLAYLGQSDIDGAGTYTEGTAFGSTGNTLTEVYYDAKNGRLTTTKPVAYGKCTGCSNTTSWTPAGGGNNADHTSSVIQVAIDPNGVFTPTWVPGATN